jgi:hypothetical protein
VKTWNFSSFEAPRPALVSRLRGGLIWTLCLLALAAQVGCASLAPDPKASRDPDRDAQAVEGGYSPGSDMPHRLAKLD